MKACALHVFIWWLLALSAMGQDEDIEDQELEQLLNNAVFAEQLGDDAAQRYEQLALRLEAPLDLNTATAEQLRSLFLLSEAQVNALIDYRTVQGHILSKYELQTIPGFDVRVARALSPFVVVYPDKPSFRSIWKRIAHEKNNYLLLRMSRTLEDKRGYQKDSTGSSAYAGSPYRLYTRFRVARAGDFSIGFTMEKDAGERIEWNPNRKSYGFGYNSIHLQVLNKGIFNNAIAGDYRAQFGQGLVLGGGFGMGKGADPIIGIRKSNIGFIPHTSSSENDFFRGAACSLQAFERVTVNLFFAYNERDGTLLSDSAEKALSAISSSGLHRTSSEIRRRRSFDEINYGAVVEYKTKRLEVGAIYHHRSLNVPLRPARTPYNQFAFAGQQHSNVGAFVNYTHNNFTFFGEVAHSLAKGVGYLVGLIGSLSARVDVSLLHRRYSRDFHSPYGNALAESSSPQNESGYYLGARYAFNKRYALSGYVDFFAFPWLRYNGYAPSSGSEWRIRWEGNPSRKISFYLQARGESKIRNTPSDQLFTYNKGVKNTYWATCSYAVGPHVKLSSRAQYSSYTIGGRQTNGIALMQDIHIKKNKFSVSLRHAFFDAEDYENRQYVYERNVWLAYSFPAYYGVGLRNYVLVSYKASKHIALWARWGHTYYTDRSEIGTGTETIQGNQRNDIVFQARIKL